MKPSPPSHRNAPWDAAGRLDGRPRGDTHPRAGGRKPDVSPSRLPVARVALRVPCPGYRVFSEDAYLAGADVSFDSRPPVAGARRPIAGPGPRRLTLQRLAGAAALSATLGAGIAAVVLAARRPPRPDRRDTASRLSSAPGAGDTGRLMRASISTAVSRSASRPSVPTSSSPPAHARPGAKRAGSRPMGTERAGSARAGSARARSGRAGSGQTATARTATGRRGDERTRAVRAVTSVEPNTAAARAPGIGTAQASAGDQQTADARPAMPAAPDAQSQFGFEH